MPKVVDKVTGKITEHPYTAEGVAKAEIEAQSPDKEVIPTYDAGKRVENYHVGGKVGEYIDKMKTSVMGEDSSDGSVGVGNKLWNAAKKGFSDSGRKSVVDAATTGYWLKKGGKVKTDTGKRDLGKLTKKEKKIMGERESLDIIEKFVTKMKNKKGVSRAASPGHVKKETKTARKKEQRLYKSLSDAPYFRKKTKEWENIGKTKSEKRGVKTYKPKKKK